MRDVMTNNMTRNIFHGGWLFFILIFMGLSARSHISITRTSTNVATMPHTTSLEAVWISCVMLFGAGAAVVLGTQLFA